VSEKGRYDAMLFWCITDLCNLHCTYCSADAKEYGKDGLPGKIDLKAFMATLSKTNKTFRITFTGGEPFLIPNIIDVLRSVTKNHYISIITNLTSLKISEFVKFIPPRRVIELNASAHIKELKRKDLLERFITHYHMCKEHGFPVRVVEIAYPPFIPEIQNYKKYFLQRGIPLHFDPYKGMYKNREYPGAYTEEQIEVLGLAIVPASYTRKVHTGTLCNAGYNAVIATPDGRIRPCFYSDKIIGHIYEEIRFQTELIHCPYDYCQCPIKYYDSYLYQQAVDIFSGKKKKAESLSYGDIINKHEK
jgi:MoaA/NifB/PqqE/SkfB family radical SAM enzyme